MREKAITCERLGKRYQIGRQERVHSLRDVLASAAAAPFRRAFKGRGSAELESEGQGSPFWALKDVSFEVAHGEVVGIIGRNGAGKSTLLKILSRITTPTEGEIHISGRVGSLLEVGTGFHPELTGRENIYLNGAILGMKRAYIRRRLEEIVEFAEIGQFIDTPVKRYSSGMYVRLAFAVAAHLEPDILIIDEVLAVGDAAFQKKCLGKMNEVSGRGKTVLFVSHNLQAVRRLCSRVILLEGGHVRPVNSLEEAIQIYAAEALASDYDLNLNPVDRSADQFGKKARLLRLQLAPGSSCSYGRPLELIFTVECSDPTRDLSVGICFSTLDGSRVLTLDSDHDRPPLRLAEGVHELRFLLPRNPLHPGTYSLGMVISSHGHGLDALFDQFTWRVDSGPADPVTYLPFGGCRMPVDLWVERLRSRPPETAAPAHSC